MSGQPPGRGPPTGPPGPQQGQTPVGRSRGRAAPGAGDGPSQQPPRPSPGGPPGASQGPPGAGGPPRPVQQRPGPPGPPGRGGQIMATAAPQPGRVAPRPGPQAAPAGVPVVAPGRARGVQPPTQAMGSMSISSGTASTLTQSQTTTSGGSGGSGSRDGMGRGSAASARGAARPQTFLPITKPSTCTSKKGDDGPGKAFQCYTNYFKIIKRGEWSLLQYRVDFKPEEDDTRIRRLVLRSLQQQLGNFTFDGTMLFSTTRHQSPMSLTARSESGQIYQVTLRLVGEVQHTDYSFVHLMNILLRQSMTHLQLAQVGRNHYDPNAANNLPEHRLMLWPGYVTSIRQHEHNILLCCELSTKILRSDTALNQMSQMMKQGGKDQIIKWLLGNNVITRYNNRTYRIDDIDWTQNPSTTFNFRGETITIAEYIKRKYNIQIKDMKQPLLVSNPNAQQRRSGINEPIKLVPELCHMTGLSDEQRANFKLMSALGKFTKQAPPERVASLQKFASRITGTPAIATDFSNWNLQFQPELEQFNARTLPPEEILAGQNVKGTYKEDNADWSGMLKSIKLFGVVKCMGWAIIYLQRDENEVKDFVKECCNAACKMDFMLSPNNLDKFAIQNPSEYLTTLTKACTQKKLGMVVVVIPNNKSNAYDQIKKYCLTKNPIPSQVVTAQVLKKFMQKGGTRPVASKVALQMACKMGGEPWAVKIPIKGVMVIGYDTWHDAAQKGTSVGAVVASINDSITRYISMVTFHKNNEENIANIGTCIGKALRAWQSFNRSLPDRIIVYRDGVGDGQIPLVKNEEVGAIKRVLEESNCPAKFTYIIVSKRINARFFKKTPQGFVNPPSGSVMDDVVTLPERYDFFLISQSVRQGTVNPTSYNVIEDTSLWRPKNMQHFTYKMTHLYYNWPGTVRVPMVCQYAHKLAYLVGQSVHAQPSEVLETLLYYL